MWNRKGYILLHKFFSHWIYFWFKYLLYYYDTFGLYFFLNLFWRIEIQDNAMAAPNWISVMWFCLFQYAVTPTRFKHFAAFFCVFGNFWSDSRVREGFSGIFWYFFPSIYFVFVIHMNCELKSKRRNRISSVFSKNVSHTPKFYTSKCARLFCK